MSVFTKLSNAVLLSTLAIGAANADETLVMPNGGTCMRASTGVVYGCMMPTPPAAKPKSTEPKLPADKWKRRKTPLDRDPNAGIEVF
jgi:hypothetical protein